ncbi:PfkB family carbohydrate kinase [Dactylosporangium sp. CA-233914]|uniref:PfkB family carbohydrate kinase n=1 Tax=Dactylosporangium sp. CA-233914 TaxID=3239934 RepID=UPI003D922E67
MSERRWVAVVGDNTVDRYVGEENVSFSGGNAFNVAVQLSRAGVAVRYFGAVGDDADADIIRAGLHANGVRATDLVALPGVTAVTDIRVTPDGDRVFEREDFGVTADYFPSGADLDAIANADWVHIGMLPRADGLRSALGGVEHGVISQDCAVADGFDGLDVAFLSAGENADAEAIAIEVREAGVPLVVVTRGADGALARDDSHTFVQQALPAKVVDTTGAGDSFIAGFIAARLDGATLQEALESGARLASATCGHRAGWPHTTTHEQDPR